MSQEQELSVYEELTELLEHIVENLVDYPEKVEITGNESKTSFIFEIQVQEDEYGKVIGKEGRIARSIRTLMQATSSKYGKRCLVEVLDSKSPSRQKGNRAY